MSIAALNWAFTVSGISQGQKVVLLALANHADDAGICFPSIGAIAKVACCSDSTARRAIHDLEIAGFLVRKDHFRADGSQTSTRYCLKLGKGKSGEKPSKQGVSADSKLTPPTVKMQDPPVNLQGVAVNLTPPPVTADTPYNHQITSKKDITNVISKENPNPIPEKRKRRTALPPDWEVSERGIQHWQSKNLDPRALENEATKFRDYHLQHGNLMSDWEAAWRTWVGNHIKFSARKTGIPNTTPNRWEPVSRADIAVQNYQDAQVLRFGGRA